MSAGEWHSKFRKDRDINPAIPEGSYDDIVDAAVREALRKMAWELSKLHKGCHITQFGMRSECWGPEIADPVFGPRNADPNQFIPVATRATGETNPNGVVWLPDARTCKGETVEVKDVDGSASTRNITVKTLGEILPSGHARLQTIDGATTLTISTNYGSAMFRSDGQNWSVIGGKGNVATAGLTIGSGDVSTPANFPAANRVIISDGTAKVVEDSDFTMTRDGTNVLSVGSGSAIGFSTNNLSTTGTLASGAHTMAEQAAPSAPAAGYVVIYPKSDGLMYSKDDAGAETALGGGGGGGVRTVSAQFGGPGGSITAGDTAWTRVPFAGTITKVTLLSDDPTGSIVVDVWKDTYANYPPTVANTIAAAAKPTLSGANKSEDSTLTDWDTSVAAGDVIKFNVDSVSGLTQVSLLLEITV